MAAPNKDGLEYFPLDVDLENDDKLTMIIGEFGGVGELVYIKLLAWVYRHRGYYMTWDESEQLKFCARIKYINGINIDLIIAIVTKCVKWNLFDAGKFNEYGILTSNRIQTTWQTASRKRKTAVIDSRFCLKTDKIKLMTPIIELMAEETPKKTEETTQSKVKESKVNNNDNRAEMTPPISPYQPLEKLKTDALADQSFMSAMWQLGVMPNIVSDFLDAFHRWLNFTGENIKQSPDYRRHFRGWITKLPYTTMNPKEYSPIPQANNHSAPAAQPENYAAAQLKKILSNGK